MSFLPAPDPAHLTAEQQATWEDFVLRHPGRLTNQKAVMLHDPDTFEIYMGWYTLFDRLAAVLGERPVHVFAHAISDANDCLICSVFFRRILIDGGDDPDHPATTPLEDLLLDFGRAIAQAPTAVPDPLYRRVEEFIPDPQARLLLISFAGQMAATNLFNSAGRVPLDEVLYGYRKTGDDRVR
ncbi:hypothetical protein [Naasia lichenicola]|uniref:Uncharacterized protein n=1 Tax=Naasia lichenicola TaxID=2565933 RepID=A0A4S4FNI3_9MICO|nr:hypothetical protein [Naasia lichenicola]THG31801.1 hypothetical protein E6C64_07050 [Naasia lichenicola]